MNVKPSRNNFLVSPDGPQYYSNPEFLSNCNSTLVEVDPDDDVPRFKVSYANIKRVRPNYPIDSVPLGGLTKAFVGSMSHGLSVRPIRFDPPCCRWGINPMDFEIAASTFGPKIGEATILIPYECTCPFSSRYAKVTVKLPDTYLEGTVGFHAPCRQKRLTISWNETNAENSYRVEPFSPPCCFKNPVRLGHIGAVGPEELNSNFVRYSDSEKPKYSTCRSWFATSPWVMGLTLSFQGLLKLSHYFGYGCQYIETISTQCEDCDWGAAWDALKECEISRMCARRNETSYRPLSHVGVRAAINDQYGIKLYTNSGDDESDLNAFGHVRVPEDGMFEYGCIYKRIHLDPTDIGKNAGGPGDVAGFDVYFRGSVDANVLEKADLQLVLGYVLMHAMMFELRGGTVVAMQMTLPHSAVQYKSLHEASRAPEGQEMK